MTWNPLTSGDRGNLVVAWTTCDDLPGRWPDSSTVRFLYEPLGDLLAGQSVIVVEVHDHRGQRQPLGAALGALFGHLVEATEQPFEMIRYQLSVVAREMVDALV